MMDASGTRQRDRWILHVVTYFIFLGVLISGVLPISPRVLGAVAVIWTGLLAAHKIMVAYRPEPVQTKAKRQMTLGDDGELVEVTNSDDEQSELLHASTQAERQIAGQMNSEV